MIVKERHGEYVKVYSDLGKRIRVKGEQRSHPDATEYPDSPHEYEEVESE